MRSAPLPPALPLHADHGMSVLRKLGPLPVPEVSAGLKWFVLATVAAAFDGGCSPDVAGKAALVGAMNLGGANGTRAGELADGGTAGAGAAAGGAPGTCSSQGCPASQVCGYEADRACSIQAHCIPRAFCNDVAVACGCDGGVVLVGCGVATRPFTGIGPCSGDAGTASGTSNTATAVSVSQLVGKEVLSCPDGYVHPNVCCQGAPYQKTTCAEDLAHPFDGCGPEQGAFPDPNACCSLDKKTSCIEPSGAGATGYSGQRSSCQNPCAPGAYAPPPLLDGSLCAFGTGMSVEPKEPPCSLCTGPVQWCSTPCPAGWSPPDRGQVDSCCQSDSSGERFCFSQAGHIDGDLHSGGVFANDSGCRGEQFLGDGNSYVVTCDFKGSSTCDCSFNDVVVQTFPSTRIDKAGTDPCGISLCGFPPL